MNDGNEFIKPQDIAAIDASQFTHCFVGCVVLTKDKKILLQQRGFDWDRYPGYLAEFGGHMESGETPMQAVIRELNEELGASVNAADIISLGAISELATNHSELIYIFFWHDKNGTITGCYEGEARFFDNVNDVFEHPKMMDSVRWLLNECHLKKLI